MRQVISLKNGENMKKTALILATLSLLPNMIFAFGMPKGIYGTDNRSEPALSTNPKIHLYAQATAAMVDSEILRFIPDLNSYIFPTSTLGEDNEVCSTERFVNQTHIATCSGFLVAKDIIITAGHCVETQADCDDFRWVFDYTSGSTLLNQKDVYKCKKIISRTKKDSFFSMRDYAIIQLDRAANDRTPLKVRTSGRVKKGTRLAMLGHPTGLPLKYDANARVAKHWNKFEKKTLVTRVQTFFKRTSYFTANLDAFAGNSGSPVINMDTDEVEGILVSGGGDYTYDFERDCSVATIFEDSDNEAQEIVFKITKIKELKKLLK